jgi:hypothetical protein
VGRPAVPMNVCYPLLPAAVHGSRFGCGPSTDRAGFRFRSRLVADAPGAPVLRDQGPIGRLDTARPMQASMGTAGYLAESYGPNRGPSHGARTTYVLGGRLT